MVYEEIRLVKPSIEWKDKALEYRQEHFDFGEQIINGSELFDKITSYEEWLKKVIANQKSMYPVRFHIPYSHSTPTNYKQYF